MARRLPATLNVVGNRYSLTVMEVLSFDAKGRPCDVRIVYPDDPRTAKDLDEYIRIYASHEIIAWRKRKPKRKLKLLKRDPT